MDKENEIRKKQKEIVRHLNEAIASLEKAIEVYDIDLYPPLYTVKIRAEELMLEIKELASR